MENDKPNVIVIEGTVYKKELYQVAAYMYQVLKQIIEELPAEHDWLDPKLEEHAKSILNYISEGIERR